MKKAPKIILPSLGLILLAAILFSAAQANSKKSFRHNHLALVPSGQSEADYQNTLNSQEKVPAINGVLTPSSLVQRPIAVVIENHPAARPQSGLSQADIVYEALAEGGITRFMAIFQTQRVNTVGPVRSARTYFNDWAQELGAIYAHVGGNSDALYYLKKGIPGLSNADQFFNNDFFARVPPRKPPHNTYTSTAQLLALAKQRNFNMIKSYPEYLFKDDKAAQMPTGSKINIDFSTPSFAVSWAYNSKTNLYKRSNGGKLSVDLGNGKNIFAKNIIVQRVRNWPVASDTVLAISMGTREGGEADVYQDGIVVHGTWKMVDGRTKYFDLANNEIKLNRGQTWIEIVPPANAVTIK
ncbi:MAG: DUF3048 domain-containing protein [Candidatus Doudnabacteria bacterium]